MIITNIPLVSTDVVHPSDLKHGGSPSCVQLVPPFSAHEYLNIKASRCHYEQFLGVHVISPTFHNGRHLGGRPHFGGEMGILHGTFRNYLSGERICRDTVQICANSFPRAGHRGKSIEYFDFVSSVQKGAIIMLISICSEHNRHFNALCYLWQYLDKTHVRSGCEEMGHVFIK